MGKAVNSTLKGNKLEDSLYQYLLDQQERGELVFEAYPADNCKIYKKKKYFCAERGGDVEFDVVIEFFRRGSLTPHSYVVFECKNYGRSIPEVYVNDFSLKLSRTFRHAAKGVLVISSRLQSGAENVARNSKMGIVKFDEGGLEIIADRRGRPFIEHSFARKQIFENEKAAKSLKFSAFYDGSFYGSVRGLVEGFLEIAPTGQPNRERHHSGVPYVPSDAIKASARDLLGLVGYESGPVDLKNICAVLAIDLEFTDHRVHDLDGMEILGSANFDRKKIVINAHGNVTRERFTLGHEIGHFFLKHQLYLASENVIESDLRIVSEREDGFNYERLEFQANSFASNLILPDEIFIRKTAEFRNLLGITDRGHGYIFVDDQPYNYQIYDQLLIQLLTYFEVSKQAIQYKLQKLGLLTDQRSKRTLQIADVAKLFDTYRKS
ncbi:ImmA/IrrE family metallo-endopeptidase [Agrobacterium sp. NPDC058088]|uniref:ImmA/IrrE family metallo-endopeptidase n=1 Tax=Agrobacterium sp. NPDC058088 TaxID=3346335 RepID=UPI0036DE226D